MIGREQIGRLFGRDEAEIGRVARVQAARKSEQFRRARGEGAPRPPRDKVPPCARPGKRPRTASASNRRDGPNRAGARSRPRRPPPALRPECKCPAARRRASHGVGGQEKTRPERLGQRAKGVRRDMQAIGNQARRAGPAAPARAAAHSRISAPRPARRCRDASSRRRPPSQRAGQRLAHRAGMAEEKLDAVRASRARMISRLAVQIDLRRKRNQLEQAVRRSSRQSSAAAPTASASSRPGARRDGPDRD